MMVFLVLATSLSWKLNTFSYILNLLGKSSAKSQMTSNCSCSLAVLEIRTKLSYRRYLKSIFRTRQLFPLPERPITHSRKGCTGQYLFFYLVVVEHVDNVIDDPLIVPRPRHIPHIVACEPFSFHKFLHNFFYICYSSRI